MRQAKVHNIKRYSYDKDFGHAAHVGVGKYVEISHADMQRNMKAASFIRIFQIRKSYTKPTRTAIYYWART